MSSRANSEPTPLEAFIKVRASLDDEPVVFYWSGLMYRRVELREANSDYPALGGFAPPNSPLFRVHGFNIGRAYLDPAIPKRDGSTGPGYRMLTRELMLYCDPKTGEILRTWDNPCIPVVSDGTGGTVSKAVQVLHVDNDPVNSVTTEADVVYFKPQPIGDRSVYEADIFLKYPSPLAEHKFARYSANDVYQAAELFRFAANTKQLLDPTTRRVDDVAIGWTRMGQYLPWMHMGQAPGGTIVFAAGYRVPNGFEGLPDFFKKEVLEKYPKYVTPPEGSYPANNVNETSWTFFKKELDAGRYEPTQIP